MQKQDQPQASPKRAGNFIPSGKDIAGMFEHDNSATKSIVQDRNSNQCVFTHTIYDAAIKRRK